jgi:hypothetical protein
MRALSAAAALQLPVRLHGIKLAQPIDLLVETGTWHVLGFVVRCGDESTRFLPFGASQVSDDEIAVASALMLLEDVDFYLSRGTSFRSLGLEEEDAVLRIGPDGARIVSSQAAA